MTEEIKARTEQIKTGKVPEGYYIFAGYILPQGWKIKTFNTCFTRLTQKNEENNDNVLTISAQQGLISQLEYYNNSYASEDKHGYTLLDRGDYSYNKSYSSDYPYGAIKRLEKYKKGIVSPLYICFRPRQETSSDFFVQYFEAGIFNREIYKIAQEGARNHGLLNISIDDFFSSNILYPPLSEQQKIADILAQCDKVIALKNERIEEEKKLEKWLTQKLLDPSSGVRLPGYEKSEWEKTNIGCVTISFSGGTPESSKKEYYCENGIPFIRSGEISSTKTELFLTQKGYQNSSAKMVNKGDLLYALYGANSGDCFISQIHGAINQAILCIRSTKVNIVFLYYVLRNAQNHIVSTYLQGGQGNLSAAIIKKISAFIPIQNEQIAICKVISTQDEKIHRLEQELAQWQQKKKALMQLLLTGIVRIKKEG